jgi:hypothetical protein
VYSVIHAPRGDATEAIVLVAALRTVDDELNVNGVALALTLARYFKSETLAVTDATSRRKLTFLSIQDGLFGRRTSYF